MNRAEMGIAPELFVSAEQHVEDAWTDYNGHLNMAFYNVLFDRGVDEAFATFGMGPDYVEAANASFFTLEAHLTYLGEIHAGDQVVTTFHLLDADEKRVHYFMELYRTSDGLLSATSEQIAMHVSMETRRSAPFPAEIAETIAAMASTQANLIRKPQVGHVIGIRRKPTGV